MPSSPLLPALSPAFGGFPIPGLFIAFFIGVVILMILGAIYGSRKEKQRSAALGGWAAHHGLSFVPKGQGDDSSFDNRFPAFDCLRQGDRRYAYNIAEGDQDGRGVYAFDYHYRTQSSDSKGRTQYHHHHFSAVVLDSHLALKPLLIRAEGWWDKMTSAFGFDDIDFESAEFSREFYVKAPDRRWAYDVINQKTMEFLLRAPRFSIELAGPHLIIWRGKSLAPAEFEHALGVGEGLLARIPADIQEAIGL